MSTSPDGDGGLFRRLRPNPEERHKAIEDPGVPWRDWFYFSFVKAWLALGFLVIDALIAGAWAESHNYVGLALSEAVAVYLEFLAFRYLWTRPGPEEERHGPFSPSWHRPVRVGRWTPEAWYPERFRVQKPGQSGPDPHEFL
ncbi:MAG: hypothetical protein L3K18_09115 [Thermoplasmata archaeon]|nr:hypothetical protein [Thermoplasmata archaeon]